ncbi:MAG: hypothetical protein IPJ41_17870 [Phycisphaerales bacterium]|nr:hypothetical protein [Phycisphaerales bacterium]
MVERYLPGREVTVSIVGTGDQARVLGVMEITLRETVAERVYSYDVKQDWEDVCILTLAADEFARACEESPAAGVPGPRSPRRRTGRYPGRRAWPSHGHRLNPFPGLNPVNSDLPITCRLAGFGYDQLIAPFWTQRLGDRRGGKAARAGTSCPDHPRCDRTGRPGRREGPAR